MEPCWKVAGYYTNMKLTSLVLLVATCLSVSLAYYGDANVNGRLNDIDKKLEIVTNEVVKLKQGQLSGGDGNDGGDHGIQIKEVLADRASFPWMIRFMVKYWTDGKSPVKVSWEDENHQQLNDAGSDILETGAGLRWSGVLVTLGKGTVFVSLYQNSSKIKLALTKDFSSNVIEQTEGVDPVFTVSPPVDIVYEPGQNVTIKMTLPLDDGPSKINMDINFIIMDPETGDVNFTKQPAFTRNPKNKITHFLDSTEIEAALNGSDINVRGVVMFTLHVRERSFYSPPGLEKQPTVAPEDPIIKHIRKTELRGLRRSDQSHPFPDGFLQIARVIDTTVTINGTDTTYCSDQFCHTPCYGIGNDIKNVSISRLLPGGEKVLVESKTAYNGEYLLLANYFQAKTAEQLGDPSTYLCEARDHHGNSVSRKHQIVFYDALKITETEATWLNDTTVEFTCVVHSGMTPNVNFAIDLPDQYFRVKADHLEQLNETSYSGSVQVTHESWNYHYSGGSSHHACDAERSLYPNEYWPTSWDRVGIEVPERP